jgi:hypothetical protein
VQSEQGLKAGMGPAEEREPEEPQASWGDLLDKGKPLARLVDRMALEELQRRCLEEP